MSSGQTAARRRSQLFPPLGCDGHHKMVDLRLTKRRAESTSTISAIPKALVLLRETGAYLDDDRTLAFGGPRLNRLRPCPRDEVIEYRWGFLRRDQTQELRQPRIGGPLHSFRL